MAKIVTVLPAISSVSTGQLFREEYPYIGSQVFTTVNNYSQVYSVEVLGVGALSLSQYHLESPNKIVIHDPLEVEDYIVIIYGKSNYGSAPYYTQTQIDDMFAANEEASTDYTDDSFVRGARLYARTGIVDKTDQFKLDVFDASTVTIGAIDSALFWDQLFGVDVDPNTAIRSFTELPYPLTELVTATGLNTNTSPISVDGIYVRYLGYDIVGGVVSSPNSFIETSAVVQLGFVTVVKSGASITFLGGITPGARNVFSQPILASLNDLDRITVNTATDITVGYNIGTPTLNTNPGTITGISINWRSLVNPTNTSSIDRYNYLGDDIVDFVSIDANFLEDVTPPVIHTLWTDLAEGVAINKSFYNTASELRDTLAASAFSIKRVLIGVRGGIFIQDGEHATNAGYATIDIAKANVYTQMFANAIVPEGLVIEIARIIFQENVTNFADSTKFFIVGTLGASSSGGGIVTVGDATTIAKGIIQLAGDLSGTATNPTVPALTTKADDSTVVHLTGTETIVGSKTFSSLITAAGFKTPTGLSTQFLKADGSIDNSLYLTSFNEVDTLQSVTSRGSVTTTSIEANSIIKTGGTSNQFLKADGSIDSTVYAIDTNVIHTSGNETRTGSLTSGSFIKSGGTNSQFLKADGSSDSTVYATDSLMMHLAGNETFTGTKSFTVIGVFAPALSVTNPFNSFNASGIGVTNSSGGVGIKIINSPSGSGSGIFIDNTNNTGIGIGVTQNSGTGTLIDLVNNGTGLGTGIRIANNNSGFGQIINNNSTGIGQLINNNLTGLGLKINNATAATDKPFQYTKNSIEKAFLNDSGQFSAQAIIKAGGTSSQYLMADGSTTSLNITTNVQSGTTYTLQASDISKQIIFTSTAAITVTIPSGLASGFNCEVLQQGDGKISFIGSGTTLRVSTFETLYTAEKYALVGIDNMPNLTEEYHLFGALQNI